MENFKDESFVQQFLSPKVIRDFHLFSIIDDDESETIDVNAIHDDSGYRSVRDALAMQYNLSSREPNIQVYEVDIRGDRSLTLYHQQSNRNPLNDDTEEVLKHLYRLWKFDVHLYSFDGEEVDRSFRVPTRGISLGK